MDDSCCNVDLATISDLDSTSLYSGDRDAYEPIRMSIPGDAY